MSAKVSREYNTLLVMIRSKGKRRKRVIENLFILIYLNRITDPRN